MTIGGAHAVKKVEMPQVRMAPQSGTARIALPSVGTVFQDKYLVTQIIDGGMSKVLITVDLAMIVENNPSFLQELGINRTITSVGDLTPADLAQINTKTIALQSPEIREQYGEVFKLSSKDRNNPLFYNYLKQEKDAIAKVNQNLPSSTAWTPEIRQSGTFTTPENVEYAYISMEDLGGLTATLYLLSHGVNMQWIMNYTRSLVEASKDMQAAGITHRDLKPGNVMIPPAGLKIIDWGLAYETDKLQLEAAPGTPKYSAPEQFHSQNLAPNTDLYPVGIMLYESMSGKRLPVAISKDKLITELMGAPWFTEEQFSDNGLDPAKLYSAIVNVSDSEGSVAKLNELLDDPKLFESFSAAGYVPSKEAGTFIGYTDGIRNKRFDEMSPSEQNLIRHSNRLIMEEAKGELCPIRTILIWNEADNSLIFDQSKGETGQILIKLKQNAADIIYALPGDADRSHLALLLELSNEIIYKAAMNREGFPVVDFYGRLRKYGNETLTKLVHLAKADWDNPKIQELTAQLYLLSVTLSEGLSDPNPDHRLGHTAALHLIDKSDFVTSALEKLGIVYYVPPRYDPEYNVAFPKAENSKAPVAVSGTFDDQEKERNHDQGQRKPDERDIETMSAPLDMTDTIEINTNPIAASNTEDDNGPGTLPDVPRKIIPPIKLASRSE
ncbi:MAG: protein kinase [Candidatus Margulisiibacteriota bacterium]